MSDNNTWFKIYRNLFRNDLWNYPDKMRLFLYLVGKARYKEKPSTKYKDKGVIINRGQFLRSYRKLQEDLRYIENNAIKEYSLSKIKRLISQLEDEERIKTEVTPLGTLFTVVNYRQYQGYDENELEHRTATEHRRNSNGTPAEQYSKKGVRKEKERRKNYRSNSKSPNPIQIKFDEKSMPYKAAAYLRKLILQNNPRQPVPDETPQDLQKWAIEMDRLNRLGPPGGNQGYNWKEIGEIMKWCQDDPFWKGNILSAGKFREKIVTLENQMKRGQGKDIYQEQHNVINNLYQKYKEEEEE